MGSEASFSSIARTTHSSRVIPASCAEVVIRSRVAWSRSRGSIACPLVGGVSSVAEDRSTVILDLPLGGNSFMELSRYPATGQRQAAARLRASTWSYSRENHLA